MYYNDDHNHLSRLANRQRSENELKTNKNRVWKEFCERHQFITFSKWDLEMQIRVEAIRRAAEAIWSVVARRDSSSDSIERHVMKKSNKSLDLLCRCCLHFPSRQLCRAIDEDEMKLIINKVKYRHVSLLKQQNDFICRCFSGLIDSQERRWNCWLNCLHLDA